MDRSPQGSSSDKQRAVLDAVAEMIVARGLGVGDRLPPELDLARDLGVGRSTVREAMKSWQGMGIVTRNKGAGTVLRVALSGRPMQLPLSISLEADSLLRTLEARRPIEAEACRLAALRADDRQRHEILHRCYQLLDALEAGEDWRPRDHHFHLAIHEASGNPLFGQLVDQLRHAFHAVYRDPIGTPQLGTNSLPLHLPLAEAIRDGQADRAGALMNEIIDLVAEDARIRLGELTHE